MHHFIIYDNGIYPTGRVHLHQERSLWLCSSFLPIGRLPQSGMCRQLWAAEHSDMCNGFLHREPHSQPLTTTGHVRKVVKGRESQPCMQPFGAAPPLYSCKMTRGSSVHQRPSSGEKLFPSPPTPQFILLSFLGLPPGLIGYCRAENVSQLSDDTTILAPDGQGYVINPYPNLLISHPHSGS